MLHVTNAFSSCRLVQWLQFPRKENVNIHMGRQTEKLVSTSQKLTFKYGVLCLEKEGEDPCAAEYAQSTN